MSKYNLYTWHTVFLSTIFMQTNQNFLDSDPDTRLSILYIQLLETINRLTTLEKTVLNKTLQGCQRSNKEYMNARQIVTLKDKQNVFLKDLDGLKEQVDTIQNVYAILSYVGCLSKI